ncbi:alpha-ketoglutarate-dependent dioxygenase AlkB [Polyangium sp. 6x1]|uniref:alpha-ketoglutarate-dependent dioxygenase AlkB family protein n=1 Tax=Polyangium sp. 6x1 TaxID=3042689 RepID=UPI00248249F8|nr:alpha-ketoglutarate-dependent dioxygenase AlkB [Polyangium sp. 6x1]MDI1450629.1 alpha-ketoglutarate-dependent dioxygenase AlkB [Polyangium sp. 6x1]
MTRIELLHGGFLLFHDPFLAPDEASAAFDALLAEVPFRQETIRLFGKTILQPRLSAWHGDPGASYTYSGLSLAPNPWTPTLSALRARVEAAAGSTFNSVLVNHYRGGDDSMGKHADDEPELGTNPVIASLSLGARRRFVLEPKKGGDKVTLELGEGNLLVMAGTTQHHYRHGVPKQAGRGPRMNLTFRRILSTPAPHVSVEDPR